MFEYNKLKNIANVVDCYLENGFYYVKLDKTVFYPEGGGQLPDKGFINGVEVLDVQKLENGIYHKLLKPLEGRVECEVDQNVRFNHSLMHSAQHLLSGVFEQDNIGSGSFYMREDHFVIDIFRSLTREELDSYEMQINEKILAGLDIIERQYDDSKDKDLDVSDIKSDKIRVIEIKDVDICACGGTHLSNTKDIKYLKIVKSKVVKDKTRITVFPGNFGIQYVNNYFNNYAKLITIVKQPEADVLEFVEKKLKENKKLAKELKKLLKDGK